MKTSWFESLNRINKLTRGLTMPVNMWEPRYLKVIEAQNKQLRALTTPLPKGFQFPSLKLLDFQNSLPAMTALSKIALAPEIVSMQTTALKFATIPQFNTHIGAILSGIQSNLRFVNSPQLEMFQSSFRNFAQNTAWIERLRDIEIPDDVLPDNFYDILETAEDVRESIIDDIDDGSIDNGVLAPEAKHHISQKYRWYLVLVYQIITSFVYPYYLSHQTTKENRENLLEIRELRKEIGVVLELLESKYTDADGVVSIEVLNVRQRPRSNANKIDKIYYNQKITVVDVHKKWLYVEWYDAVEELPKHGWVFKKYIKTLES